MVHDDETAARTQHPPCLVKGRSRLGNDAHHVGREGDVESGVGELEPGRIHEVKPLDLREPLAFDPRPGGAEHRRADVDPGHQRVARQEGQFEAGADADHQDLPARSRRGTRRARRREPAGMKRQIEDEVVHGRPAAIGRLGMMAGIASGRVQGVHGRESLSSAGGPSGQAVKPDRGAEGQ